MNSRDIEFVIYTWDFDEKIGGQVALYKLCDILNHLGYKARICLYKDYLHAYGFNNLSPKYFIKHPINYLKAFLQTIARYHNYKGHPCWKTPQLNFFDFAFGFSNKRKVVVYPEIVDGNPLDYKHVVRWIMNVPGHFTKKVNFGENELYFLYSKNFNHNIPLNPGSELSDKVITVSTAPECFYPDDSIRDRNLVAYCVRKGRGKPMVHDPENAVLIDGMPLGEVAEVMRHARMFVSYDSATALNLFALLCHCPSYVILGENETPYTYRSDPEAVNSLAYSLDDTNKDWSQSYRWAEKRKSRKENESKTAAEALVAEVCRFFFTSRPGCCQLTKF